MSRGKRVAPPPNPRGISRDGSEVAPPRSGGVAVGDGGQRPRPPRNLVAERIDDELVVFTWDVAEPPPVKLTTAERAVLARVVRGESNEAIARARKTSVRTIANQVASLLRKTGAASRFDLIRRFGGHSDG
jgi:DNA-binding NarL/FixJ family response regulator